MAHAYFQSPLAISHAPHTAHILTHMNSNAQAAGSLLTFSRHGYDDMLQVLRGLRTAGHLVTITRQFTGLSSPRHLIAWTSRTGEMARFVLPPFRSHLRPCWPRAFHENLVGVDDFTSCTKAYNTTRAAVHVLTGSRECNGSY